jgi:hypothetical protein
MREREGAGSLSDFPGVPASPYYGPWEQHAYFLAQRLRLSLRLWADELLTAFLQLQATLQISPVRS